MKISRINRSDYVENNSFNNLSWEYIIEEILLENQVEYLKKKYPSIDPANITLAIDTDRANAEKLVMGLRDGIISEITPEAVAAVSHLNPFAKVSKKSEQDLKYEAEIKQAKTISPRYWQWVLRVLRADPAIEIAPDVFDYISAENIPDQELLTKSYDEIKEESDRWHEQQFKDVEAGGVYSLGIEQATFVTKDKYYWVQVDSADAPIEGSKMQNCIGRHVKPSSTIKIYSCRNKFNNPHVSVSILLDNQKNVWYINEIKGKQNKTPPIDRYIPPVLEFIDFLITKKVLIGRTDFWNLPINFDKYFEYYYGDILSNMRLMNLMPDPVLNKVVSARGITESSEELVSRFTSDTVRKILSGAVQNTPKDMGKFFLYSMKQGKISEAEALKINEEGKLPRQASLAISAIYKPQDFIKSILTIDPSDFALAFANYESALSAMNIKDEALADYLNKVMVALQNQRSGYGSYDARDAANKAKVFLHVYPKKKLVEFLRNISEQRAMSYEYSALINYILTLLADDFSGSIETKAYALSLLPTGYSIPDSIVDTVIYSTPLEDLKRLYNIGNSKINFAISNFLASIQELSSFSTPLPKVSRSSPKQMEDAERVLFTNDLEDLRKLRRSTNSRNVKILVDRKIARKERLTKLRKEQEAAARRQASATQE